MKHQTWIAAAAVAALLAATPALRAQDATAPTGGTDATSPAIPTVTPINIPTITPVTPIDYSVLLNQNFDYTDLTQAKDSGLTDDQIATVANIAEKTGQPFSEVRADLLRGDTFASLATKYNLSLDDVYNVDEEKTEIQNYKQAYETTGTWALKAMQNGTADSGTPSTSM